MDRNELLRRIKAPLAEHYGSRLKGVVLFGSEARGEAGPDSDIDVFVLLDGPVVLYREIEACVLALYPLSLEWGRCIDSIPVDAHRYEEMDWGAFGEAKREGIAA